MGKVNEFQRKQLASSAVGTAPADRSGAIIGGAISKLGTSVANREAIVADQQATVQANYALMTFGLGLQKINSQLQTEMAANPTGYGEKLLHDGEGYLNTTANSIADPRVRSKFLNAGSTLLRAGVLNAGQWVIEQKKRNAIVAAKDSMRLGAIQTGQTLTLEGYLQNAATIEELLIDDIPEDILSTVEVKDFFIEHGPNMLESHLSNRAMHDPQALIDILKSGKYDKVPNFTAAMKTKFINSAQTIINRQEAIIKDARTDNFQEASSEFVANTLTFDRISALETAENPMEGIEQRQVNQLREGLIKRVSFNAKLIGNNEPDAKKYIDLTYKIFNDRVERSEILADIVDIFTDGVVDREEAALWMETRATIRERKTANKVDGWNKSARMITDKAAKLYDGTEIKIKEAMNLRNLATLILLQVSPIAGVTDILKRMVNEKLLQDNSNLGVFDDPLEASYELRAVEDLTEAGFPLTDANKKAAIADFKADNNKADDKE